MLLLVLVISLTMDVGGYTVGYRRRGELQWYEEVLRNRKRARQSAESQIGNECSSMMIVPVPKSTTQPVSSSWPSLMRAPSTSSSAAVELQQLKLPEGLMEENHQWMLSRGVLPPYSPTYHKQYHSSLSVLEKSAGHMLRRGRHEELEERVEECLKTFGHDGSAKSHLACLVAGEAVLRSTPATSRARRERVSRLRLRPEDVRKNPRMLTAPKGVLEDNLRWWRDNGGGSIHPPFSHLHLKSFPSLYSSSLSRWSALYPTVPPPSNVLMRSPNPPKSLDCLRNLDVVALSGVLKVDEKDVDDIPAVVNRYKRITMVSSDKIRLRVREFSELGLNGKSIIRKSPCLVDYKMSTLKEKFDSLLELFGPSAQRMIESNPSILTLSWSNIQRKIQILERWDLRTKCVPRAPSILTMSEKNLNTKLESIAYFLGRDKVSLIVSRVPNILAYDVCKVFKEKIFSPDGLSSIFPSHSLNHPSVTSLVIAEPRLLIMSLEGMRNKKQAIMSRSLKPEVTDAAISRYPTILTYGWAVIGRLDYFEYYWGRKPDEAECRSLLMLRGTDVALWGAESGEEKQAAIPRIIGGSNTRPGRKRVYDETLEVTNARWRERTKHERSYLSYREWLVDFLVRESGDAGLGLDAPVKTLEKAIGEVIKRSQLRATDDAGSSAAMPSSSSFSSASGTSSSSSSTSSSLASYLAARAKKDVGDIMDRAYSDELKIRKSIIKSSTLTLQSLLPSLDVVSLCEKYPSIVLWDDKNVKKRVGNLKKLWSPSESARILSLQPCYLLLPFEHIQKEFSDLLDSMEGVSYRKVASMVAKSPDIVHPDRAGEPSRVARHFLAAVGESGREDMLDCIMRSPGILLCDHSAVVRVEELKSRAKGGSIPAGQIVAAAMVGQGEDAHRNVM